MCNEFSYYTQDLTVRPSLPNRKGLRYNGYVRIPLRRSFRMDFNMFLTRFGISPDNFINKNNEPIKIEDGFMYEVEQR